MINLNVYSEFLDPCPVCDGSRTEIRVTKRKALSGVGFSYDQLGVCCLDCGFSFVNKGLSAATLKNRNTAERLAVAKE